MQENHLDSWVQRWLDAGLDAYRAGQPRHDYPFAKTLASELIELWQFGWDTGAMVDAVQLGSQAQPGDPCPYADRALAACWRRGFIATHGFSVFSNHKKTGGAWVRRAAWPEI